MLENDPRSPARRRFQRLAKPCDGVAEGLRLRGDVVEAWPGDLQTVVSGVGDVGQADALSQVLQCAAAYHGHRETRAAVELSQELTSLFRQPGVLRPRDDVRKGAVKVQGHEDLPLCCDALVDKVHVVAERGHGGPQTPPRTISRRKRPAQA